MLHVSFNSVKSAAPGNCLLHHILVDFDINYITAFIPHTICSYVYMPLYVHHMYTKEQCYCVIIEVYISI
jgi:hypothetical protein